MKSLTHSWFGRSARNCRWTRSSGHSALVSETVVLMTMPRFDGGSEEKHRLTSAILAFRRPWDSLNRWLFRGGLFSGWLGAGT